MNSIQVHADSACVCVYAVAGSESRMLRHLQRRHRLSVDRHYRRETWELHPQGV